MSGTQPIVVLRHGEMFLKGRNRHMFEQALVKSVERAIGSIGARIETGQGRLFVVGAPAEPLFDRLGRIFGIASLSSGLSCAQDLDTFSRIAVDLCERAQQRGARSFRIATQRPDKRFPLRSVEVNAKVGAAVVEATGLRVDLERPDATVGIEIGEKRTFVFERTVPGAGGLPVGTGGRAMLLISGGIDSPVAGYLAQRRGLILDGVFFDSFPLVGPKAKEKVIDLCRVLAQIQGSMTLFVVPFAGVQRDLAEHAPAELLVVLYRRMMLRIAERLAEPAGARGLVTGDNLGQVASQTLENLDTVGRAATLALLRPLLCYDKAETIALARRIGTYETSILPHEDCCSLFVPKHPATRSTPRAVEAVEKDLPVASWIETAVRAAERLTIGHS